MKCQVCGAESGWYPLCRACNKKKEAGKVIKCTDCGKWHYKHQDCSAGAASVANDGGNYAYSLKKVVVTPTEVAYQKAIKAALPLGYQIIPNANLATFIQKTIDVRFHTELFRNVDFLITDGKHAPRLVVEINDRSHLQKARRERDQKVKDICEEAGIAVVTFWTSYGVREDYIKRKITEALENPSERVHHYKKKSSKKEDEEAGFPFGCYVATCVYGSYDCPEVWTLRRYRDNTLRATWYGRLFIRVYYAVSPKLVKWFGKTKWFKKLWKGKLDRMVANLQAKGVESTPYQDQC